MIRKIFAIAFVLTLIPVAAFLLAPSPIDSVAFIAPSAPPMTGVLSPNNKLKEAELIATGLLNGPEDVDVDSEGRIYTASADGKILRILPNANVEEFAITGGRTLGMQFAPDGNLIVCDSYKGLLSINPSGEITTLLTEVEGERLNFTDDVDISSDGVIYFSDASSKFGQEEYKLDLMEAKPYGRLISYDPRTKEANVLLRDLYFANGVALSKEEDFVLVNETFRYRITRYWLKGENAGSSDIFIDNLPGVPDGVSSNGEGSFWVALPTPRIADVDTLHKYPTLKNLVAKLPEALQPKPLQYGFVLELDESANIVRSLHDMDGTQISEITSVEEHSGYIYLGTLHGDRVARLALTSL